MRFPRAQLETCLEAKTMTLLEEREQEESVRLACAEGEGMEKLAQCPHCPYKCYLPEGNKVIEVRFSGFFSTTWTFIARGEFLFPRIFIYCMTIVRIWWVSALFVCPHFCLDIIKLRSNRTHRTPRATYYT